MERAEIEKVLEKKGYRLGQMQGRGAFSEVYRVERQGTGESYACKVSRHKELIQREKELLENVRHPLFAEAGENWLEADTGFLIMELIEGENLGEAIRRGAVFSAKRTAEVGIELAEGLLYLHEKRTPLLFRDVKPDNIVIRRDGRVKLLDFGCVCALERGHLSQAGTLGFAAPEQLEAGGKQSFACDVYGLGQTLLRMLGGGRKQGRRESRDERRLRQFLDVCTKEKPSERPADMRAVIGALMPLCNSCRSGRQWRRAVWQEGIICEKNIRKSACENY